MLFRTKQIIYILLCIGIVIAGYKIAFPTSSFQILPIVQIPLPPHSSSVYATAISPAVFNLSQLPEQTCVVTLQGTQATVFTKQARIAVVFREPLMNMSNIVIINGRLYTWNSRTGTGSIFSMATITNNPITAGYMQNQLTQLTQKKTCTSTPVSDASFSIPHTIHFTDTSR